MAEAIGITSGLVALVLFAFNTSKSAYATVSSLRSHRGDVKAVQTDLESLVAVLDTLRAQAQSSTGVERLEALRYPIHCCAEICKDMQAMLDACASRSTDGSISVRDWLKMQYRGKSFDDVRKRLTSYKATLVLALETINM